MSSCLRVLLVDDHQLFREGLAELLRVERDLEIVGQVGDSEAAVEMAGRTRPDVVLLDVEMPFHPVPVTMYNIKRVAPETRILILTMHDDLALMQRVLADGASGVMVKKASRQELVGAIRTVGYRGAGVVSVPPDRTGALARCARNPLSHREIEVLRLAAGALSNAQIAAELYITEGTVKRHLTNIYAKLGAVSRLDAVNKAQANWLIDARVR
jgi:DNA-binding NarL/FixJ family response regulator